MEALQDAGYNRVIGICDAPSSTKYRMAQALNVSEEELYVEFSGLNHLSWITSVKKRGEEILPCLLTDKEFLKEIPEFSVFDQELLEILGFLPNEYLYYYYYREKALENIKSVKKTRGMYIEEINRQMMKELAEVNIDDEPEEALQTFLYYMQLRENSYMSVETGVEKRPVLEKGSLEVPEGIGYAGVMLDCIEGLQSDEGKHLVLCVKNEGTLDFLRNDDVIECTCQVSIEGIVPVLCKSLSEDCRILVENIKFYEREAARAIACKTRKKAVRALMAHPLVQSYSLANSLLNLYDSKYEDFF